VFGKNGLLETMAPGSIIAVSSTAKPDTVKAVAARVAEKGIDVLDAPICRGRFAADISFQGQLYMRVVRSNFAHGRLQSIDASAALAKGGVHAVWTAADVDDIPPIDFRLSRVAGLELSAPGKAARRSCSSTIRRTRSRRNAGSLTGPRREVGYSPQRSRSAASVSE